MDLYTGARILSCTLLDPKFTLLCISLIWIFKIANIHLVKSVLDYKYMNELFEE